MTLEELKAYREKCIDVQSTLKKDIEYINNGVAEEEKRVRKDWTDFTLQLAELIQYLPDYEDMQKYSVGCERAYNITGSKYNPYPCVKVRNIMYSDENCLELMYDESVGSRAISMLIKRGGVSGGFVGSMSTCYKESDIPTFAKYKNEIYNLAKECVADCNKKLNNILIEKNKESLNRVEELKEI